MVQWDRRDAEVVSFEHCSDHSEEVEYDDYIAADLHSTKWTMNSEMSFKAQKHFLT